MFRMEQEIALGISQDLFAGDGLMRFPHRLEQRHEQHVMHRHPHAVGDAEQVGQRRMQIAIGDRAFAAQHQGARQCQHADRQPLDMGHGPALPGIGEAAQVGLADRPDQAHHLPPVRAHRLQRGHVHRLVRLVAVARIGAASPVGRDIGTGGRREGVGLAHVAAIAIEEQVRGAEHRHDHFEPAQLEIPPGQGVHQRIRVHPAARLVHWRGGERRGHRPVVVARQRDRAAVGMDDDAGVQQIAEHGRRFGPVEPAQPGQRFGRQRFAAYQCFGKGEMARLVPGDFLVLHIEREQRRAGIVGRALEQRRAGLVEHQHIGGRQRSAERRRRFHPDPLDH